MKKIVVEADVSENIRKCMILSSTETIFCSSTNVACARKMKLNRETLKFIKAPARILFS